MGGVCCFGGVLVSMGMVICVNDAASAVMEIGFLGGAVRV